MHLLRPGIKEDPVRRWNLRDRVFFACGACHILAHAFLERFPSAGFRPIWIRPRSALPGNHVFVTDGDLAFDDALPRADRYLERFDHGLVNGFARRARQEHQAREITIPVLLLWGDADPISPVAVGQRLAELFPRAELVVVDGGTHDLVWERAAEVVQHIDRHLAT